MYTIYTVLRNHVRTVVLSLVLVSCCIGQVWAQGSGGYEDFDDSTATRVSTMDLSQTVVPIMLDRMTVQIDQERQADFVSIYPMPFNPETTIRFNVQAAQSVRLTVYDVLGRAVQVLVDGRMETGAHEARFEAHSLPSGMYFARLQTATGVVTRSMVLAK